MKRLVRLMLINLAWGILFVGVLVVPLLAWFVLTPAIGAIPAGLVALVLWVAGAGFLYDLGRGKRR